MGHGDQLVQFLLDPFPRRFDDTAKIGGDDVQIVRPQRGFRLAHQLVEDVAEFPAFFRGLFTLEGEDAGHQEHGDTAPFLLVRRPEIRLEKTAHQGGCHIELAGQVRVFPVQKGFPERDIHILDGLAAGLEDFFEGGAVFFQGAAAAVIEGQRTANAPRDDGEIFPGQFHQVFLG